MTTFNGEKFVEEQIESLLSQTYQHWTLIIRDDCSHDKTVEIIKKYQQMHPDKINLIEDNLGRLGVIQNAKEILNRSNAKYMMFCDQDDVWLPTKIEISLKKIQELEDKYGEQTPLLVFTDLTVVDEQLKLIYSSFWNYQKINSNQQSINYLLVGNIVTGCTLLINNSLKNKIHDFPPEIMMYDWWIALVCSAFGHMACVETPTILYRQHKSNTTGARNWLIIPAIKRLFNVPESIKITKAYIKKTKLQGTAFYNCFHKLLSSHNPALLNFMNLFSRLDRMNYWQRVLFLSRNRCFLGSNLKTIGYILLQ